MHVHFFSPAPPPPPAEGSSIEECWKSVGGNTGNLLFINALVRQVEHDTASFGYRIDTDHVNATTDLIVIPAANWLQPHTDLTGWYRALRGTKAPIFLAGLGAHSTSFSSMPKLPEGTIHFLRMVSERTKVIATRGDYTTKVLAHYGFRNAVTTGCPSLYMHATPDYPAIAARPVGSLDRVAVQGTRHKVEENRDLYTKGRALIERALFLAARTSSAHYIFQSEREELGLALGRGADALSDEEISALLFYYRLDTLEELAGFIARSKVFFELEPWFDYLSGLDLVIGSRLHGCIAGLTAGVKSILLTHDTRTREMASYAQLPAMEAERFKELSDTLGFERAIATAEAETPVEPFLARYPANYAKFRDIVEQNGVAHRLK